MRGSSTTRSRHHATRSGATRRPRRRGPRRRGPDPPEPSRRAARGARWATSAASSSTVPRPHAYGSSGRAAARATPAAIPTDESRAELTTVGSPHSAAMSSARRTPPSGGTLTTTTSAAPSRATRTGSSAFRIDSSAAILHVDPVAGQPNSQLLEVVDRRTGLLGVLQVVDGERGEAADAPRRRPTRALASTRILARAPTTSRVAATRSTSSASVWPGSATLTFTVSQPSYRARTAATWSGGTAGRVALTGIRSRTGAGQPSHAASMAAASQRDDSAVSYSRNGPNSPQPSGPRRRTTSRWSTPRNRIRSGRVTTRIPSSRSSRTGSAVMWRRRPRGGSRRPARCDGAGSATSGAARRAGTSGRRPTRRRRPPAPPRPRSSGSTG